MRWGELIDVAIKHTKDTDPNHANNSTLRERTALRGYQIIENIWEFDWDFTQKTDATLALSSGNSSCDAPTDFIKASDEGGLFIDASNAEIRYHG